MIGKLDPNQKKVHVIGAGISGLLIGYQLRKKGYDVTIHEASDRAGGMIRTLSTPYGPVETAANSLLVNQAVKGLMDELGVKLIPVHSSAKARYVVRNRKMKRMPLKAGELISTLSRFFSRPKKVFNATTGSLQNWGETYLGRAATQYLLNPFVTGIYAALPEELNAQLSFPKLVSGDPRQSLFSFFRSKPKSSDRPQMMAIEGGTEALVQALAIKLKNQIRFNSRVSDYRELDGNVVISVPAPEAARLFEIADPVSAQALRQVKYAPLITTTFFVSANCFRKSPRGVGVLIPRTEPFRLLGCLFNSSSFPSRSSEGFESFTAMMGGTSDESSLQLSDEEIKSILQKELGELIGLKEGSIIPACIWITRWKAAIPVYSNQLRETLDILSKQIGDRPGLVFFTNYSGTVSIRGLMEQVVTL